VTEAETLKIGDSGGNMHAADGSGQGESNSSQVKRSEEVDAGRKGKDVKANPDEILLDLDSD